MLANFNTVIRIPLIPGITDTEANISGILEYMREVGLKTVQFLPYNPSAAAKYEWLGLDYGLTGEPQTKEQLDYFSKKAADMGLHVLTVHQ